jgi:UDP-galactopyranose mutase
LELRNHPNKELQQVADFVYEKIFLHYTMKQWGLKPDEIDVSVTGRVPVYLSYDNRYFQDKYQGMPSKGYTVLFERMLSHPNIEIQLSTHCSDVLKLDLQSNEIYFRGSKFEGEVVYTGAIDELLSYCFGVLPYRSLDFEFETHQVDRYQTVGTVNYPNDYDFTRITEYKHLTGQDIKGVTTIMKEYPLPYSRDGQKGNIPYYPIIKEENNKMYEAYRRALDGFKNLHLVGRLAEYKYYNMDIAVEKSLDLYEKIKEKII